MSEKRFVYDEDLEVIQYWEDGMRYQLDVHNLKDVTVTLNTLQSRIELLEDNCLADTLTRKHLEGIIDEQQATISALKKENKHLFQSNKILQQEINDAQQILEMLSEKLKGWK